MEYNLIDTGDRINGILWGGDGSLLRSRNPKTFFAFGINHRTAPVGVRERLHLRDDEIISFLSVLKADVAECVVLSTCNRTEVYAVSESREIDSSHFINKLIDFKAADSFVQSDHFFALVSCSASQQLLNVATSIDSRVIGDSQILRQLRVAYDIAQRGGFTGKVLNQLFQRAFKLGKMTYTETSIHDGAVSVSLAAVELGVETFGSLRGRTAMVIGAGEMAQFTAEALAHKKIGKILVANRTRSHAEEMLASLQTRKQVECESIDFENFKDRLGEVDIVISSTSSDEPILYAEDFAAVNSKKLVIDIAVPRDVDVSVGQIQNVVLRNVDDLRSIIDSHHEKRIADLPKVRKMIVTEMVEFLTWYYSLPIMPEYEITGSKPSSDQKREILKVKQFLNQNLSEIHRLAAKSGGSFHADLESHFSLITRLQELKTEAFAMAAV